jgi:hypothetical protein
MRFIKRFVVVLVLLVLAFFFYRLINPTGAKALLFDLKNFSNNSIGTNFSLTQDGEEVLLDTWTVLGETGVLIDNDSVLQEIDEADELLLGDISLDEETFTDTDPVLKDSSSTPTPTTTTTPPPSSSTTSSSKNGLSNQDLKDFKNLFGN